MPEGPSGFSLNRCSHATRQVWANKHSFSDKDESGNWNPLRHKQNFRHDASSSITAVHVTLLQPGQAAMLTTETSCFANHERFCCTRGSQRGIWEVARNNIRLLQVNPRECLHVFRCMSPPCHNNKKETFGQNECDFDRNKRMAQH